MKGNAYRSTTTGDKGFMMEVDGKKYIELDRPSQQVRRLYKEKDWIKEDEHRPLLPQQIGRIHFEAQKYLLIAVGDPEGHKMDWLMMQNQDRNDWMQEESDVALVRALYDAMDGVLSPLGL